MLHFSKMLKQPAWIALGVALVLIGGVISQLLRSSSSSNTPSEAVVHNNKDRSSRSGIRTVSYNEPLERNGGSEVVSDSPEGVIYAKKGTVDKTLRAAVTLWNCSAAEFKSRLLQALGGKIQSRTRPDGGSEYLIPLSTEHGSRLWIEPNSNRVEIEGPESAVRGTAQLVHALDAVPSTEDIGVRCVSIPPTRETEVQSLIQAVLMDERSRATSATRAPRDLSAGPVALAMQGNENGVTPPSVGNSANEQPSASDPEPPDPDEGAEAEEGEEPSTEPALEPVGGGRLVAPVQVQVLEGMDALIIRGRPEDVKRVADLIRQIEEYSKAITPAIEVAPLKFVDSTALGTLLNRLYDEVLSAREGTVSITPMAAPNALLLIGRPESVAKIKDLIEQLDQPVSPTARFQVFRLKNVPATEAQESITSFFEEDQASAETAMAPRVYVVADFRSNSLIVRANPNDMAEVAAIIARLDSGDSAAFNEVRIFKLKNASAETLAPVLQDAMTGQMYGQRARTGPAAATGVARALDYERKSTRLRLVTIDAKGQAVLNSGILTDAQVTADPRTNGLIVTASADSMPLIGALIRELDSPPSIESQVKVFTLINGDATNMAAMLQNIFGAAVAGDELAVRTGIVPDETSLVGLNFAVDVRTNSIIVTGSAGALTVVEAVLARLDGSDPRERKTAVVRIKNIQAADVATVINQYLTTKRDIETANPDILSVFEQIEREVIVVAEPASNSVIISATPRYFDDIMRLVDEIDRRQPMIMIQVVIAEVSLDNFSEFGVELGLEDSILFNRSVATGGLAIPGTLFSNGMNTGGRGVTSFGTGQVNTDLSFGGLVLNASSESVSVLVRALQSCSRMKVLSRPQIMTLDNEPAQIVVGEDVPFITGTSFSEFGQQNSVDYREVGLILTVTPRVSAEGLVVMEIVATNSKVGPIDQGIPVSVAGGEVIRSPRIQMISAQTVVSSMNGQTVVMGGLIVEDDRMVSRRVPWVSSIPLVGNLFKYESKTKERKELLIIMTPRIVENAAEADRIAQIEASRLHWCRSDVQRLHGGYGGDPFFACPAPDGGPHVIYPDETPTVEMMPEGLHAPSEEYHRSEIIATPPGMPMSRETSPHYHDQFSADYPATEAAPFERATTDAHPVPRESPATARPSGRDPGFRPEPATVPPYPEMPKLEEPTGPGLPRPAAPRHDPGAAAPNAPFRGAAAAPRPAFGQSPYRTTENRGDR